MEKSKCEKAAEKYAESVWELGKQRQDIERDFIKGFDAAIEEVRKRIQMMSAERAGIGNGVRELLELQLFLDSLTKGER